MSNDLAVWDYDTRFAQVPEDFPRAPIAYSLSGVQEKLALVPFGGRLYQPGTSPPEVCERWDMCEDLAKQLAVRCKEVEHGKYKHIPQAEILGQYLTRLLKTGWGTDDEMKWVVRRTASLLGWPSPPSAARSNTTG